MALAEVGANGLTRAEREELLAGVQRMIVGEVRRAGVSRREYEDMVQELQLLVWTQTEKFDPTRGVKFSSYACACIRRFLVNWKVGHNSEEHGAVVASLTDRGIREQIEQFAVATSEHEPDEEPGGIGDVGGGLLANAVRRALCSGILDRLGDGHRRIVEAVAFEGLTADQIATQNGHPVKAVRANLKQALRKLCAIGATGHAATDAEVQRVTAPRLPMSEAQRKKHNAHCREKSREQATNRAVSDLETVAGHEAFTAELDQLDADMRVIVTALLGRDLTVDQSADLLGVSRKVVLNRVKGVVKAVADRSGRQAVADHGEALAG